jgi:hypothetical protein
MGISRTICLDWLWITILPISASQVARIPGVSHQRWAVAWSFCYTLSLYTADSPHPQGALRQVHCLSPSIIPSSFWV